MESNLIIEGIGFPRLSCRGVTQSLRPIHHGEMRRSVNGELCYVGTSHHHKYKSTIVCEDQNIPGLQQLWVGKIVRVQCVSDLWESVILGEETTYELSRKAVAGSITVIDQDDRAVAYTYDDQVLTLPVGEGEKVLISYRPLLDMRIKSFRFQEAEWEKGTGWCLDLEEV